MKRLFQVQERLFMNRNWSKVLTRYVLNTPSKHSDINFIVLFNLELNGIIKGQCPSLYNHNELAEVAASVSPSTSQTLVSTSEQNISLKKKPHLDVRVTDSRTNAQDKLDRSLEFYFSRILKNLHVVVMASIPVLEGGFHVGIVVRLLACFFRYLFYFWIAYLVLWCCFF